MCCAVCKAWSCTIAKLPLLVTYWQAWCCRCCLAARKDDLIKYGRKLLKSEAGLWRDPEIIAEVLGLAEDTEHRGNILLDIEGNFTEQKVRCRHG